MNQAGIERARDLVVGYAERWKVPVPDIVRAQASLGSPFTFRYVRSETAGGICTITLNRPDAMNALNEDVVGQLEAAFAAAAGDEAVKGIVIAGSGKAFVAGADIRFFVRNIESGHIDRIAAFTTRGQTLLRSIERCAKPVVARVHGLALGGGVELALACHAIVAAPKATLAFPETGIGIYPGLGGTQRAPRRIGTGLAKWLILTGQTIDAKEALAIGLVDKVVPYENLDAAIAETIAAGRGGEQPPRTASPEHRALADFFTRHDPASLLAGTVDTMGDTRLENAQRRVAGKAPIALRIAADLIERSAAVSIDQGLELELSHLHEIFSTKDAYEGLSSIGRKPPAFTGA
jgi:enoyl-CoA hydratase / 3-hydroxyacyl-CoA dehydrogenase